jgi:hypothetical protein
VWNGVQYEDRLFLSHVSHCGMRVTCVSWIGAFHGIQMGDSIDAEPSTQEAMSNSLELPNLARPNLCCGGFAV